MQGQYYFGQRTKDGILRPIDLFTRTTALAPNYADGFAALADAHATAALDFQVPGGVPAALDAVNKALTLDPNNPTAIMARATVELLQWRWRAGPPRMCGASEQLHVNTAAAWHMRAIFFDYMGLSQFCGQAEEQAIKLDPLSFIDHYNLALYRMRENRTTRRRVLQHEAWALQPGNPDLQQVNVQIALGKHDMKRAEQILAALVAQSGEDSAYTAAARFFILVAKRDMQPRTSSRIRSRNVPLQRHHGQRLGIAYALTHDTDRAMMWFRRAVDLHEASFLPVVNTNPLPASVLADPRWKALRAEPEVRDWENARREIEAEFQAGE